MHMIRTRPFSLARDFDTFFGEFGRDLRADARTWSPRVDAFETDDHLTVRFELAGFSVDDIELSLEEGILTVAGRRSLELPEGARAHRRELARGDFSRSIRVTDAFDPETVEAAFVNGLLEVTLQKRPEVLPRSIEIQTV